MSDRTQGSAARLGGLALFSAAILFTEIGLTRLFSVLYYPPVVFSILTLAVLGVGAGASLAAWKRYLRCPCYIPIYMLGASASMLLLVSTVAGFLSSGPRAIHFALAPLPFLFAGLGLATLFSNQSERSPLLYAADLSGAGLGALLVVPVLGLVSVPVGLVAGATAAAVAALPFARRRMMLVPAVVVFAAAALMISALLTGTLSPDMARLPAAKPISERLVQAGSVVRTDWDAFARTDLVDPGGGLPYQIYVDGAAASVMPSAQGNQSLLRDIGFFPFATEQPARVFVIGPGGGLDIWFGLQANAQKITAVEVNPASVDIVKEYSTSNGGLYADPRVEVLVDEGRSVLQRSDEQYDLIFMSQVVTLAAEREGYALVENSVYTVEAFDTYLDHLTPHGQIALKLYDEPTLARAMSTAIRALQKRVAADQEALQHIIALLDRSAGSPIPLLLIGNAPYSREDVLSIAAVADSVGFAPLFLPGVWAEPPLDKVVSGEVSWNEYATDVGRSLSPTTDDAPFFFQFETGLPSSLRPLLAVLAAIILGGVVAVLVTQRGAETATGYSFAAYFALLGAAFMLSEITLIQQTRLFLGHPTYAITGVLAILLIGGGVGSGVFGKLQRSRSRGQGMQWWPPLVVGAWLVLWLLLWPVVSRHYAMLAPTLRIVVVLLALLPVAFFLGIPFPVGLRAAGRQGDRQVAIGWAINGLMSVAGSVAAVALAMLVGYTAVLITAAVLYAAAALPAYVVARRE